MCGMPAWVEIFTSPREALFVRRSGEACNKLPFGKRPASSVVRPRAAESRLLSCAQTQRKKEHTFTLELYYENKTLATFIFFCAFFDVFRHADAVMMVGSLPLISGFA